ncbi:hypothetical protein [Klebsiella pneumoniae]|uniref:hypothetical protein n=1 Tax=Klebsiella pneumoniae TaxID=573 RepID=UPI001D0F3AB1|nr:hypothetical protein [Klebsiella pneumoniae]
MINDKYHIQYYFMCLVRLSYQWQVSRRADPKIVCSGSAGALPALSGQETQYAAVLLASLTLYVVSLPCPEIGRSAPEKGGVVIP